MNSIPYTYQNLPIPGGGYVTGFAFHSEAPEILYARTDIGGVYRYLYQENRWKSLMDHVKMTDLSETFPIAIALDPQKAERLFIACGENKIDKGILAISTDYGETFQYERIPALVHGNLNGRGTGNRLIVDHLDSRTLYFASQQNGLLKTRDLGKTWSQLKVNDEAYMTMIWQSPKGKTLIVGTAGVTTQVGDLRGASLYVSYDEGAHFTKLMQPQSVIMPGSRLSGYVAQRYTYDGRYFYVTLSNTGAYSYVVENGYSCDSGDAMGGKVLRYELDEDERIIGYEEITPCDQKIFKAMGIDSEAEPIEKQENPILNYGFSGISSCKMRPGMIVCSTICRKEAEKDADCVFLSYDYGRTWKVILYDLSIGKLSFKTPYMKPEYNGQHSILHWMSDVKINPFNPDEVWLNSGTGVFKSENLTNEVCLFHDQCEGLEETVHLNLYSPPDGKVQLIDILGDLGGFAFTQLDVPCENSFADDEGNRYITCINADYSDLNPNFVVVTPRGNWTGKTRGGLIVSEDQCKTFKRLEMPYGLSNRMDEILHQIEKPNVNSGWVAVSPDCNHIVWSIAEGISLPKDLVVYSTDRGKSFKKSTIYNRLGRPIEKGCMKVFSDRRKDWLMYGFGEHSDFYISHDGGASFREYPLPEYFPKIHFGMIDCANQTEIRADAGQSGVFYMALGEHGLWKMIYHQDLDEIRVCKLSQPEDKVYHLGLGVGRENGNYLQENKALYICGVIQGEYGFFSSLDEGKEWTKLNNHVQMFGDINSIEGDSRCFGRFYIATGSRGVLYGEPKR